MINSTLYTNTIALALFLRFSFICSDHFKNGWCEQNPMNAEPNKILMRFYSLNEINCVRWFCMCVCESDKITVQCFLYFLLLSRSRFLLNCIACRQFSSRFWIDYIAPLLKSTTSKWKLHQQMLPWSQKHPFRFSILLTLGQIGWHIYFNRSNSIRYFFFSVAVGCCCCWHFYYMTNMEQSPIRLLHWHFVVSRLLPCHILKWFTTTQVIWFNSTQQSS